MESSHQTEGELLPTDGQSPLGESADDLSDKTSSGLNKNLLRCLLILLPVGIPIVVYLKDIDATRRIFLAAFILFLVIVFSCMLMALLRSRRRSLEDSSSNSEIARELAHRHLMAVTNRFLPRGAPHARCHRQLHETVIGDPRRPQRGRLPIHYQLAPTYSRSPSPRRAGISSCRAQFGLTSPSHCNTIDVQGILFRRDDPPPYEEALRCPLANAEYYRVHTSRQETPPPSYERAVT
ncbi:uncharacterized protein [Centruroides vittatus]|uniref:uncharacterized protein n=1 Tax=Centruroides vittatus TaxID=120091 RepID=UPI00350FF2EA